VGQRLRRRLRRVASLLANLRGVAVFAGGYWPMVRAATRMYQARGLGAVAGWAVSATAHGKHLRAASYRKRLRLAPAAQGSDAVLAVASTAGVAAERLAEYVALLRRSASAHGAAILLVTDRQELVEETALDGRWRIVQAQTACPDTILDAARQHGAAHDFALLLRPGAVPAPVSPPRVSATTLLYGDEDHIDAAGRRCRPIFKPGFSPDLLLANDYLGSLLAPLPLLRACAEERLADHHSLALRLVEQADEVRHVPTVLAHRFCCVAEPAAPPAYLPTFLRNRYGAGADVRAAAGGRPPWRCAFGNRARVSVIVPTRDRVALLRRCVEGIFATNSGDFEVVVLDNGSREQRTRVWLAEAQAKWARLRVVPAPGAFNWSRLNNLGIAHASGDVFVFLNNDTEPHSAGCGEWLARLADVALRPDVGAVGPLLLYAGGHIQHAGVVVGADASTDHVFRGALPEIDRHVFVSPLLPRNVAAVTGACMAFSRRALDAIGNFDENYRVAGGDVEICVRAMTHGLVNVYLPDVVLLHLESRTRGRRDPGADVRRLRAFLAEHCPQDPYHHPQLASGTSPCGP